MSNAVPKDLIPPFPKDIETPEDLKEYIIDMVCSSPDMAVGLRMLNMSISTYARKLGLRPREVIRECHEEGLIIVYRFPELRRTLCIHPLVWTELMKAEAAGKVDALSKQALIWTHVR